MTAAGPLVFPSSRVLAGWWQQLVPVQPQALWVAHLLVHRVEALVCVQQARPLDRFARLVLRALILDSAGSAEEYLHLGPQVLRRVLQQLEVEGLVAPSPLPLSPAAGARGSAVPLSPAAGERGRGEGAGRWLPTPLGRHALDRGDFPTIRHERRQFVFVPGSQPEKPTFLSAAGSAGVPCPAPEDWSFDPAVLWSCVRQSAEWKERHGFPLDVEGVAGLPGSDAPKVPSGEGNPAPVAHLPPPTPVPEPPEWQRVILDRAEQLTVVLVGLADERLLGFAVHPEGWALQADQPTFTLEAGGREIFPELAEEPGPDVWRQLWRAWCQPRHLPQADIEGCVLERSGPRLRVTADRRLLARLSAALKGDTWLLAGSGRIRTAALLEMVEAK